VIPSGDHGNHLKEFGKNPNKGYYKHAPVNLFKQFLKQRTVKKKWKNSKKR
jgi:hypothetical protein